MAYELDDIDRRILDAVQADNQISAERLADLAGLSPSAAQRRLKRLRDESVIVDDFSVIDPKSVGRHMTFIVELTLERENLALFDAFKRKMRAAPEIQQCYAVTGDADFIMLLTARDMQDYDEITGRLFVQDGNIRRFRTSVVMSRVKVSLAVPAQ